MGPTRTTLNALDLNFSKDSLSKTTKKKITLLDGFDYLNLASKTNAVAIDAYVNYAGENLKSHEKFDLKEQQKLTEEKKITTKTKQIIAYGRSDARRLFNFKNNGFMFDSVHSSLLDMLKEFDENKSNLSLDISSESRKMLKEWAKKQKLQYTHIIPLGAAYRKEFAETNLSPSISRFSPLPMTHIDFNSSNTAEFMNAFADLGWKFSAKLYTHNFELTDVEFENLKIIQMVNIWMPLNEQPTENTLAIMDTSRIKKDDLLPITFSTPIGGKNFTAMTLRPSHKHQFVIQSDMKLGDAVIFNSFETPHTAVTMPRAEATKGVPRESIEIRAIFI